MSDSLVDHRSVCSPAEMPFRDAIACGDTRGRNLAPNIIEFAVWMEDGGVLHLIRPNERPVSNAGRQHRDGGKAAYLSQCFCKHPAFVEGVALERSSGIARLAPSRH